jgi:hypothetical protein
LAATIRIFPEALPLAKARDEARRVLGLILGGTSPKVDQRHREEEQRRRQKSRSGASARKPSDSLTLSAPSLRNSSET